MEQRHRTHAFEGGLCNPLEEGVAVEVAKKKKPGMIWVPQDYGVICSGNGTWLGTMGLTPCVALAACSGDRSLLAHFSGASDANVEDMATKLLGMMGGVQKAWIIKGTAFGGGFSSSQILFDGLDTAIRASGLVPEVEQAKYGEVGLSLVSRKVYDLTGQALEGNLVGDAAVKALSNRQPRGRRGALTALLCRLKP